ALCERGEVDVQDVGVDQRELAVRTRRLGERGKQVAVELDRGQAAVALQQREGHGALARADLDDAVARLGVDREDDLCDHAALVQEVLPQRLLGRPAEATHAAHPGGRCASRAHVSIAANRLEGSARPLPARSKAVPWSTATRGHGRPRVRFTARSKPLYLSTGSPWSWYIARTASNPRSFAGRKAVSAGSGPCRDIPSARSLSSSGSITSISSRP